MLIPKWLQSRFDALWSAFQTEPFRVSDAAGVLKKKTGDSRNQVNVILAELRKKNLLISQVDPIDARKRIYHLKSEEEVITQTLAISQNHIGRGELNALLKSAADLIRTRVDYSFILLLLFYKRISDKWGAEYEQVYRHALEDGLTEDEAKEEAKNSIYHDFDIPEEFLWEKVRAEPARMPENFSRAMKALADKNPELRDAFENVDFVQFTTSRENAEILRQLVELFSAKPLYHVSPDILGDAYEWILGYFAPQKAKEGEVYTSREVIKLVVETLDPKPGDSVYDPACGSGGMLISAYRHVEDARGRAEADKLFLYGEEINHRTLALAKMNLYIHDIRNGTMVLGDTLLYPKFKEGEHLRRLDVVIANPPWNQDGYGEEILKRGEFWQERYSLGFNPKQSADWAWVQHMLASAKEDTGRVGVVIDNGCLFRGAKEKAIRSRMLTEDLIEAVILLPEKLFYNTGAPGAIMILRHKKPRSRKGKVLFINASREYEQHPEVRKLNRLGEKNIGKIAGAYKKFREEEGFSRAVGLDEIKDNDYNLNVTLYVFPEDEVEEIDIQKEWRELKKIEGELAQIDTKIESYLKELKLQ